MKKVLTVIIFGYGFSIEFRKDNFNPKNKNSRNDGSIEKYDCHIHNNKYDNPFISATFNYDYDFVFRLMLNRLG